MKHFATRRALLLVTACLPIVPLRGALAAQGGASAEAALAELESGSGGRLGVFALDTGAGASLGHRGGERFPFCSTFKLMLAAAVLKRSESTLDLLQRTISYAKSDLVSWSPVTGKHVGKGMSVAELCAAAIQYSDNSAANLLIGLVGGPAAVTAFARSIGDETFRLDRIETELNTAIPGDERDTTTPEAMARSMQKLVVGDALAPKQRDQLAEWLLGNTTGAKRIRAGVPQAWRVADKTGTGDHGTTNDVAVVWPPSRAPIVLVVYFTQRAQDAKPREDVIAKAAKIVADALGG
jgi:beta-lactamase class A